MKYYKLTDEINFGEIIRQKEGTCYTYSFGQDEWERNGIIARYQWPDDPLFGKYVAASEQEAQEFIEERGALLRRLYAKAQEVAAQAHAGQADKGGQPYIEHPMTVAAQLDNIEHKIVALLHDVIEDSEVTADDLRAAGFTERIVRSVELLTKNDDEDYEEYLKSVKQDSNAWHVKKADLRHNMDISRISNPTEKDFARLEKYKNALLFLEA